MALLRDSDEDSNRTAGGALTEYSQSLSNTTDLSKRQQQALQLAIDETGLENCVEQIALATPEQLAAILDVDLWHSPPGRDETFDAARFGRWSMCFEMGG